LGLIASLAGGLFIGAVFYYTSFLFCDTLLVPLIQRPIPPSQWPVIGLGAFAGLFGSIMDSVLGATLQYSGWDSEKQKVVSEPTSKVTTISGMDLLDNHQVNFVSSVITAITTAFIAQNFFW